MDAKYILQICGDINDGSWLKYIHEENDVDAINHSETILKRSRFVTIAGRANLWFGDKPVKEWQLSQETMLRSPRAIRS